MASALSTSQIGGLGIPPAGSPQALAAAAYAHAAAMLSNPFAQATAMFPPHPFTAPIGYAPYPPAPPLPPAPQTPQHSHRSRYRRSSSVSPSPSRRHRHSSPPSDSGEIQFPDLATWLTSLDEHPVRGADNQQYSLWTNSFYHLSLLRLDDLAESSMTVDSLCALIPEMVHGTASRLLRYAREDKGRYESEALRGKRRRHH